MAIERDVAELEAACAWWQERLRLRDWKVRVRWADLELARKERSAQVEWQAKHKEATIDVMVPELYPDDWSEDARDWHTHLAHELLHLHFLAFAADEDTPESIAQEQAIELIAQALARLKREADGNLR